MSGFVGCPYCEAAMLPHDNQREERDRIIPASRFWMECVVSSCRARGPIRPTIEQAEQAATKTDL